MDVLAPRSREWRRPHCAGYHTWLKVSGPSPQKGGRGLNLIGLDEAVGLTLRRTAC
ncbi:hypothetical protein NITMOv2_0978 [Nitrospira moscoviensis]|uniref:Uncharacterized protein n=1 Tax=Nitrospira moscoviensis TaxID=42253 RepID=A0A0K2G910_NITMO|nr:hypothetical protein NITMOv2_0978 [Nitrospira moscoviensis]